MNYGIILLSIPTLISACFGLVFLLSVLGAVVALLLKGVDLIYPLRVARPFTAPDELALLEKVLRVRGILFCLPDELVAMTLRSVKLNRLPLREALERVYLTNVLLRGQYECNGRVFTAMEIEIYRRNMPDTLWAVGLQEFSEVENANHLRDILLLSRPLTRRRKAA